MMPEQSQASLTGERSRSRWSESRKPRHREIFESILGDIAAGRFQPGDRVPTEAELAKTFSASRTTIARAMRDLKTTGILNRQRGAGTHIAMQQEKRLALFAPFTQSPAGLGYIGNTIYTHLSELATQRADRLSLQIISRAGGDRLEQMLAAAQALIEQGVAGVFYYPVELPREESHFNQVVVDALRAAGMAVICVDRDIAAFPNRSGLALVTYDNRRGGYLLAEHMISHGCKRIAFVDSPFVSSACFDRLCGVRDAMAENNLPCPKEWIRPALPENLDASFCRAMMDECKPDGIICKMDHYAALVGRHLMGMGMTIGKDIMLAGFDDDPLADLLPVPLTTIRFPADPFAQGCYERLLAQLADPSVPRPSITLIDVELVIRESTGLLNRTA